MPNRFLEQSSTTKPSSIGSNFSADIVKRSGQMILLVREYVSSYSLCKLVPNEKASTLRAALVFLCSELAPQTGPPTTIKVDPASACRSLVGDKDLKNRGLAIELGHPKYKNKNPVAERGIRELHSELNRELKDSLVITENILASAVARLNSRLRGEGLSSREIWTSRDQFTGMHIPVNDLLLMKSQNEKKERSRKSSAVYKARGKKSFQVDSIRVGSLVYVNSDRDKTRKRDRYIVTKVDKSSCEVQKFTGMQLRARPYTVHRADILTVQPWIFPSDTMQDTQESDEEDIQVPAGAQSHPVNGAEEGQRVDSEAEGVDPSSEDEPDDTAPAEAEERTSRCGRKLRRPAHLGDYVMERDQ